jgi:hypothetical protein
MHLHHLPQSVHCDDPRQGHHRDARTPARRQLNHRTDDMHFVCHFKFSAKLGPVVSLSFGSDMSFSRLVSPLKTESLISSSMVAPYVCHG